MPVPIIFIARTMAHVELKYILFFALAAIMGQILGGKLEF